MPIPNLIHPIAVVVEKINRTAQAVDPDTRAPLIGASGGASDRVTFKAQVYFYKRNVPTMKEAGMAIDTKGTITARIADLRRAGITLARGDKVVQLGGGVNAISCVYWLTSDKPMASYDDVNGFTLIKWEFSDRCPLGNA